MAAGSLAVELEAAHFQLPDDFRVSESRETAHSRSDHDRVVPALTGGGQTRNTLRLTSGLNQLPSDVACNVKRLSNGPALRNEPGEFFRGCEKQALWQFLDLYSNRQLHTNRWQHLRSVHGSSVAPCLSVSPSVLAFTSLYHDRGPADSEPVA